MVCRDKMLAYSTYKNMWTSSGKKKLVVDASKVTTAPEEETYTYRKIFLTPILK